MSTFGSRWRACASVSPIAPTSGSEKTAVGTLLWSIGVDLPPNTVSAKAWPSRIATGVRLTRLVTSPTAWMLRTDDCENSSTAMPPFLASRTPVVVEIAQDIFAAIDQSDLGAEAGKNARELDCNIAATLDEHTLGQRSQMERLVRRDDMFDAHDRVAVAGRGAGGNQNMPGADFFAGRKEAHGMRVFQHGTALDQLNIRPFERGGVSGLEPGDLAVLVGDQLCPVEGGLAHGPAIASGVLELVGEARGIDQKLLRHAASDDTGAADPVFLGNHDPRAIGSRDARGAHPARARTDHEKIDVAIRHAAPFARPAR